MFVRYENLPTACQIAVLLIVLQFSKKQFNTLYEVIPTIRSKYPDKVQFIFRQQIQPWHPSSTLVHEAGVAVLKTNPDKFWDFSKALFDKQTDYFDVNVVNETRNKTYERLSKLAGEVGLDSKKIYELLEVSDKPDKDGSMNIGNKVTEDLKIIVKVWLARLLIASVQHPSANGVQVNRLLGIHVSPTVMFNVSQSASLLKASSFIDLSQGVVEPGISSSFGKDDWDEWLKKNIT